MGKSREDKEPEEDDEPMDLFGGDMDGGDGGEDLFGMDNSTPQQPQQQKKMSQSDQMDFLWSNSPSPNKAQAQPQQQQVR